MKEVLLLPSSIAAQRDKNKRDQRQAQLERLRIEDELTHIEQAKRAAYAEQRAQIAEAEARELRSIAEGSDLLERMDPALLTQVGEHYGDRGVNRLLQIARRAGSGPARSRELDVRPTEDPEQFPDPPKRLPPAW